MFWSSEKETNKRQIHTARTLVESGNGFKILHISLYFPISDSLPFFHLFHFRFACSSVTYTLSNSSPFGGVRSCQTLTGPETQHDRIKVTDQLTVCGLLTHTTQILRDGRTTRGSEEMEKDSGWRSGEQRG